MPAALAEIRHAGVGPTDIQQAVIGPGKGKKGEGMPPFLDAIHYAHGREAMWYLALPCNALPKP